MDSGGGRIGGRGGSLAGPMFPKSRMGKVALIAGLSGLLWIEPGLWVLPAAMLLGGLMCVLRVRGQPLAEAGVGALGGAVLFQVSGPVVSLLALPLAATLSSVWEATVAEALKKRGWLGAVRMRELRGESPTGPEPAEAGGEVDPPLRIRVIPEKIRTFVLGAAFGMILLVPLAAFLQFHFAWSRTPPPQPSEASGLRPAPVPSLESVGDFDWELVGLDGREVPASDLRGKVLFVNRWATWCAPCVLEMPGIEELTRWVPDEDVAWLPISDEPLPTVVEFAREQAWELPLYVALSDAPAPYAAPSIPTTFIVDREGRIVFRHVGAVDWNTPDAVRFLTDLIGN